MSETSTSPVSPQTRLASIFTDAPAPTSPVRRVIRTVSGADEPRVADDQPHAERGTVPASSAYPHLFDLTVPAGKAMGHVSQALLDAQKALHAYSDGDLDAVQTELGLVATQLAAAYPLVEFNRDFASIVAFIRRACLAASAADTDREMLSALVTAIRTLWETPTISLMDAAKLTLTLEGRGWHGSHRAVEKLLRALLDEPDSAERAQADMFGLFTDKVVGAQSS
jgi:hypothetical protein